MVGILLILVSPQGATMVRGEGKNFEFHFSRLAENRFLGLFRICDIPQEKGTPKDVNVKYQVQNAPDV